MESTNLNEMSRRVRYTIFGVHTFNAFNCFRRSPTPCALHLNNVLDGNLFCIQKLLFNIYTLIVASMTVLNILSYDISSFALFTFNLKVLNISEKINTFD